MRYKNHYPKLGDVIYFKPSAWSSQFSKEVNEYPVNVRGIVIDVNKAHRHYTLAGKLHGKVIRETFKVDFVR